MRIGTTSFIYPGGWLHNVERLAPHFDDIEILFFEAEGAGSFPDAAECRGLAAAKREHGLSYSLHTPLAASLASQSPARRDHGLNAVRRAIDAAALLEPEHYVVHVYLGESEGDPAPPRDLAGWRARAMDSLGALLDHGVSARQLCVEALDYDFALIHPVVEALDLSIALDIGHWVRDGREELRELERYLPRARLLQWHGTDASGRDHRSLCHYPADKARALLTTLAARAYEGVLTLEVFDPEELHGSEQLLARLWLELGLPPRLGRRAPFAAAAAQDAAPFAGAAEEAAR